MKLRNPFKWSTRPDPSEAARELALAGIERRKAKIRATVDRMREEMGMEPARWPQ